MGKYLACGGLWHRLAYTEEGHRSRGACAGSLLCFPVASSEAGFDRRGIKKRRTREQNGEVEETVRDIDDEMVEVRWGERETSQAGG